jgi:Ca2+-binding RTX toxin-like protein
MLTADILIAGTATTGQLQTVSDIDVFKIDVVETGIGTLSFNAPTNSDYQGYYRVSVYAPDGGLLTSAETGKDLTFEGPLTEVGTYYFAVEAGDWYYTDQAYQLTVDLSPGLSDEYENEPNDEYANYLSSGSIKRGTLATSSDVDWFYLNSDGNDNLNIVFNSPLTSDSAYFNVWVYDEVGNLLARQATGNDIDFDVTASAAGEYYIGVTSSSYYSSLEYALTATVTDASGAQESELNDSLETADSVTLDAWFTGQLSLPTDTDYFQLDLTESGTINLQFDTPSNSAFDSYFTLDIYDEQGVFLTAYELGQDAVLNIEDVVAGTYYMRVSAADNYSAAAYRFNVSLEATFTPPADAIMGTSISDILVGDASDNSIYGMGGNDLIDGGEGQDTLVFQAPISSLQINEVEGITSVRGNYAAGIHAYSYSRVWNTEFLQTSDAIISLTSSNITPTFGTADDDRIVGTANNDLIDGLGGNDFVNGAGGTDTLAIFGSLSLFELVSVSGITKLRGLEGSGEYAGHTQRVVNVESIAFSQSSTYSVVTTADNLIFGTQSNDNLVGTSSNDTFDGLGGNDLINGGAGFDTLALFAKSTDFNLSYSDTSNEITLVGRAGSEYANSTIYAQNLERIAFTDKFLDTRIRPELVIDSSGSFISEAGKTSSLSFSLSTAPSSTVFVHLTADDQLSASQATLSFDESNWDQLQTITVSAVDDSVFEEQHPGTLTIEVQSSDPFYGQLETETKIYAITDNDVPNTGSVEGILWADTNFDGSQSDGELGLPGWTVFVDANSNGQLDTGEKSVSTDITGYYRLDELDAGSYTIAAISQSGWQQTHPDQNISSATVIAKVATDTKSEAGDITINATANFDLASDYSHLGDATGISAFHADSRFAGIDGSGYSVVVIDSGIDLDHSAFGPDADGDGVSDRVVFHFDFSGSNDSSAQDVDGHGTHVAGIIGSSESSYPGIAPDVNIIALKVFPDEGGASDLDIQEALRWVVQNQAEYNIVAVNLSLGVPLEFYQSYASKYASDYFKALVSENVIVTAASGNDYDDAYYYTGKSILGVQYPSAERYALSVGAVWANDGGDWGTFQVDAPKDALSFFSQRDDELSDIFAPGGGVYSAYLNDSYALLDGTSMASPYIAGMVVLAQQLAEQELGRRLSFEEIRTLLSETGTAIVDGDDENAVVSSGLTYKRADMMALAEAILALKPAGTYTIDVTAGQTVSEIDFGFASTGVTQALSTDDLIAGTSNGEIIKAGAGNDEVIGGGGDDALYGEAGDDYLYAGSGNDFVDAGDGDDLIIGGTGAGDDEYIGGPGIDTVSYTSATAALLIDLKSGTAGSLGADDAGVGTDTLSGIENAVAGKFNDYIVGDELANDIDAGLGNDTILPGASSDNIDGGLGWDTVRYVENQTSYEVAEGDGGEYLVTHTASGDIDTLNNVEVLEFLDTSLMLVDPNSAPKPVYFGSGKQLASGSVTVTTPNATAEATITSGELVLPVASIGAEEFSLSANLDTQGAVGISDVIAQLRHIVGLSELSGVNFAAGDNDANGEISISDVISSLRTIVGLQESGDAKLVDALGEDKFTLDTLSPELYAVAPGDADLSWSLPDIV